MIACRGITIGSPEHEAALRLREAVLRAPLGLGWSEADLADEPLCLHLAAFADATLVAALLLKPLGDGVFKMRQVAVDPAQQGRGIGARLIAYAESVARERGARQIVAHARGTAADFYRRLGYRVMGEPFVECTIPHVFVEKDL